MSASKTRIKYLKNYAEHEASLVDSTIVERFDNCLVIPCYDEDLYFINRLNQRQSTRRELFIIVINQPENTETNENNEKVFKYFQDNLNCTWQKENLSLYDSQTNSWLIVERYQCNHQIPKKQGVGLARKIGCDIAVALHQNKNLTNIWLHSSDADTHLPDNYFEIDPPANVSAGIYKFKHICHDNLLGQATTLYEQALYYYVSGLKWAGSPYAFHTIGSCLSFSIDAYCQARGFPKRAGGEDFYLLNKLAKINPIFEIDDICLEIDARASERVAFGTGPAVSKIMSLLENSEDYLYYSPKIFEALKRWLAFLTSNWPNQEAQFDELPNEIKDAANFIEVTAFFEHSKKQAKDEKSYIKFVHQWFDAFRTLKFVHFLQRNYFEDLPLEAALAQAEWKNL